MSPKALEHKPGETFGPFELERPLGKGAAAEVWLAIESSELGFTKRQAIKLLQPPPDELEEQKRALINEARVCGLLKHPGIVDVYKVDSIEGELFIAMEFVDGPDLNTLLHALRLRNIALPVGAGIEIAIELCEALDYAHTIRNDDGTALGIIHRDLKPSNVLVDRRGVLKITDWGLVKSHLNIDATTRGVVKGTPGYIAPEVWGGTREFKPAADLFAVGAILYEAIMGERLFQGRNLARLAEQVARRAPKDEAARVEKRCPDLVPILEKLLQRNPDDRYKSAKQLLRRLRKVREQYPARESFKGFLREFADLVEEIAPVMGHGTATAPSTSDENTVETDNDEEQVEEPAQLLDPGEDSLWDGSISDGDAEQGPGTESSKEMAATSPIPIVVATRPMPSVDKTVPSGAVVSSLPTEAEETLFEGMEEQSDAAAAQDPADAATDVQVPVEADGPAGAAEEADEDAEVTLGDVPAPIQPAEDDEKEEAEVVQVKHARRKRRAPARKASNLLPSLMAYCIFIGGVSLLLTGIGFTLFW